MRLRAFTLAAVLLPLSLSAQDASRASATQGSTVVVRTFLSFGRPYGGWLLMAFDSIPAARYGFRPTPVQQSVGYIAQHLEGANYELCSLFGAAQHVMTAKDSLADTVKALWPKDTLIARVRASLVFCAASIGQLSDASLADTLTDETSGGPVTVRRMRYPLLLVTDLAEHYSQISNYMRLLGLVPPSALPPAKR
ncbi:MAG: DinB family protein [Gemmatimonadota bacterium]|nr:DinB family protein [Gemmatimonadota bacterium]